MRTMISTARQSGTQPEVAGKLSSGQLIFAGTWRRFLARSLDIFLGYVALGMLLELTGARQWAPFDALSSIAAPYSDWVLGIALLPLVLLVEAVAGMLFGSTPGKKLLGVRLNKIGGARMSARDWLVRGARLWAVGLAFGVPLITMICGSLQARRLDRKEPTTYDRAMGIEVTAIPLTTKRKFGIAVICILAFAGHVTLQVISQTAGMDAARAAQRPAYPWENPATQVSAHVPGEWTHEIQQNAQGDPLHVFTDGTKTAMVIIAMERAPIHVGLSDYGVNLAQAMSPGLEFKGGGSLVHKDGIESWRAEATTSIGLAKARTRVEVRQHGHEFWRVVVVQGQPHGLTDDKASRLTEALWKTVPIAPMSMPVKVHT